MKITENKIKSVIFGHAVADALGVPVEFCSREELLKNPVIDMEGFGTYPFPAGCWSDDTSMSLATLDSLANGKIDYDDIMINFGKWYYKDEYTPTGEMFDVGNTCSIAIDNYFVHHKTVHECGLTDEHSNGNGSLMRIHPFVLYLFCNNMSLEDNMSIIHKGSALTHSHERSQVACGIYAFVLYSILMIPNKGSIILGLNRARRFYIHSKEYGLFDQMLMRRIGKIYRHWIDVDDYKEVTVDDIKSSGYVVDTLEAAIWCLITTKSYRDCVLKAVNLGDDTDTVAAVAGGLAGTLYGYDAIPKEWTEKLKRKDYIEKMCETASQVWSSKDIHY